MGITRDEYPNRNLHLLYIGRPYKYWMGTILFQPFSRAHWSHSCYWFQVQMKTYPPQNVLIIGVNREFSILILSATLRLPLLKCFHQQLGQHKVLGGSGQILVVQLILQPRLALNKMLPEASPFPSFSLLCPVLFRAWSLWPRPSALRGLLLPQAFPRAAATIRV